MRRKKLLGLEKQGRQTVCYLINQYTQVGMNSQRRKENETNQTGWCAGMSKPVAGANKWTAGAQGGGEMV
jgi:hypothetical protein